MSDILSLIESRIKNLDEEREEYKTLHTRKVFEAQCEICGLIWNIPLGTELEIIARKKVEEGDLSPVECNCEECQSILEG